MASILEQVDLRDPAAVITALIAGMNACRDTPGRRGCTEWVEIDPAQAGTPAATLIATGDLHDNPLHLARLAKAAGIISDNPQSQIPDPKSVCHLTLHELIHGDRLINGLDYSYRVLVRAAVMKAAFPERVHILLANHEIAQLSGIAIAKEGVRCNEAFDEGVRAAFAGSSGGMGAEEVIQAIHGFLISLPLAVRFRCAGLQGGDVLCAHSLPTPEMMGKGGFDLEALDRELVPEDFTKRTGAARAMTWGRGHTPEQIATLAERWNVRLFILGHEKAEDGFTVVYPQAIVLNSDHERGVYARVDLTGAVSAREIAETCVPLSAG